MVKSERLKILFGEEETPRNEKWWRYFVSYVFTGSSFFGFGDASFKANFKVNSPEGIIAVREHLFKGVVGLGRQVERAEDITILNWKLLNDDEE